MMADQLSLELKIATGIICSVICSEANDRVFAAVWLVYSFVLLLAWQKARNERARTTN
jgi:hypothetical protein